MAKIFKFQKKGEKPIVGPQGQGIAVELHQEAQEDKDCSSAECKAKLASLDPPGTHAEVAARLNELVGHLSKLKAEKRAPEELPPNSGEMLELMRTIETLPDGPGRDAARVALGMSCYYIGRVESQENIREFFAENLIRLVKEQQFEQEEQGFLKPLKDKKEQVH